jgi:hypothetical protein
MRRKWMFFAPLAMVGMLAFVAIGGVVVQQLWNWLLPALFGWRQVTFWQAVGLLALSRILVGGFGLHGSGHSHARRHFGRRFAGHFADRVGDRWDAMTPEEREGFRQRMRERCGFGSSTGESKGQ